MKAALSSVVNSYNEQAASGGGAGGIPPAHGVLNGIVASLKSLSGIQALLIGVMLMAVVIGVTITVLNVVWMAEVGDRLDRALDAVREARIGKAGLEHASIASLIGEKKVHDEERMSLEYDAARKTFRSLSRSQMGSAKAALAEAGRSAELMREKLTYLKTELADAVEYFAAVTTAPKRPAKNETDVNASEDLLSETNNAVEGGQEGASFRRSLTDDDQRKMVAMIMGQLAVAVKSFNDSASSPPVDDNKFNAKAVVAIDED
ncbi:hypothetical protein HK101_009870 [Irineochytrium annulatum]|nr:hypothetical protein HK101_009870 [Irineochytrium annulatum]